MLSVLRNGTCLRIDSYGKTINMGTTPVMGFLEDYFPCYNINNLTKNIPWEINIRMIHGMLKDSWKICC